MRRVALKFGEEEICRFLAQKSTLRQHNNIAQHAATSFRLKVQESDLKRSNPSEAATEAPCYYRMGGD